MVSFSCEACGDVLVKKKLDAHRTRCHGASFTCIDCMVHFPGLQYRSHTSCISEAQKYQGALYKDKTKAAPQQPPKRHSMAQQPYVEDVIEDDLWTGDEPTPAELPPEAPTPPDGQQPQVNVFDFLVASGQTPNSSTLNLPHQVPKGDSGDATTLLKNDYDVEKYLDASSLMDADTKPFADYGNNALPASAYVTPLPKSERRKAKDSEMRKDKKRKRLHLDVPGDQVMTDAPPILHSNLTGGLKGLMRPALPPSPEYSGVDVAYNSPASPPKKSKHSKRAKHGQVGGSILDMFTGASKTKSDKKKKKKKSSSSSSSSKKHSRRHHEQKEDKLIEFGPPATEAKGNNADGQIIVYKPRADAFLSFVTKGPESERGCSMNKALKRYHRERQAADGGTAKTKEEKELWKDLRLRRNDRGEIVLFAL
ncbi:hypothetical protein CDD81_272 [Ophiocordyceps australis]|uniref:Zinc finger C2H2 LYAR-type domain-containing protein n=1 Tax=Ophiocordyceps australis TaxID=1399860 RepID=A0A2C5XW93_9HYPO|nr:hypothetical protein CDD81_272 [Ophiocordyceps australis]